MAIIHISINKMLVGVKDNFKDVFGIRIKQLETRKQNHNSQKYEAYFASI